MPLTITEPKTEPKPKPAPEAVPEKQPKKRELPDPTKNQGQREGR